ncbi:hypothetical protein PsunGV_gp166 [Pseudalatia unipuncta granulovirus]|uniref:Uncharacterized protein n=1 Tax=Pseudalatia unipuncta granulosis virus TaxID=36355 RepID=B6S735_GVPU|nr:hypothetical protein PsunGV_gp166 [Pseudalatia unipuncta granulovirus]ACH69516.1 unknown [Pseudalatia unipuncta granulovirus]
MSNSIYCQMSFNKNVTINFEKRYYFVTGLLYKARIIGITSYNSRSSTHTHLCTKPVFCKTIFVQIY